MPWRAHEGGAGGSRSGAFVRGMGTVVVWP